MAKPKQLLIATGNYGKFHEMMEVLGDLPYQIVSLTDIGLAGDCEEDGNSFEENAVKKATYYAGKSGLLTLAEDSGILVDSLAGELGVKTRRWGKGERATDTEWIEHFLKVMDSFPESQRGACFVCCSAVADAHGKIFVCEGRTAGVITHQLEAPLMHGLPLSSCFRPDGFDTVYAALGIAEKNRISHRGKAMHQVRDFLIKHSR